MITSRTLQVELFYLIFVVVAQLSHIGDFGPGSSRRESPLAGRLLGGASMRVKVVVIAATGIGAGAARKRLWKSGAEFVQIIQQVDDDRLDLLRIGQVIGTTRPPVGLLDALDLLQAHRVGVLL